MNDQASVAEQLRAIPTGNISDALYQLGIEPCSITGPLPLALEQGAFAGPAFTVQQRAKTNPDGPGRTRHAEAIDTLAAPGDVVVIDVDGRLDVCTLGGLLALRGKERGLAGFLVNGCVRDAADIRATGFGVHCLGTSPRKSSVELETASIGEPVTIGGCLIGPGDFIVADDTGAVVIPAGDTDRVLALALDIKRREDLVTGRIGAGSSLAGAFESIGD